MRAHKSGTLTEPLTRVMPEIDDGDPIGDEFCHIRDQSLTRFYCGRPVRGPMNCKVYEGEAICPSCGKPTCPTCAVQSSLNARLEER